MKHPKETAPGLKCLNMSPWAGKKDMLWKLAFPTFFFWLRGITKIKEYIFVGTCWVFLVFDQIFGTPSVVPWWWRGEWHATRLWRRTSSACSWGRGCCKCTRWRNDRSAYKTNSVLEKTWRCHAVSLWSSWLKTVQLLLQSQVVEATHVHTCWNRRCRCWKLIGNLASSGSASTHWLSVEEV